jgi:MFS family permease
MSIHGIFFSFGIFYKPLMDHFGWTAMEVALAPSTVSVVYVICVLPVSMIYKRLRLRLVILLGGLLTGSGLALCSQVTTSWQLCLFYGIMGGIGTSTVWVPFTSTIMNWFTAKRGLAMGIALSGSGLGSLAGPPLLTYITLTYGWQNAFMFAGALALLVMFSAGLVMKGRPEEMRLTAYCDVQTDQSTRRASQAQSTEPIANDPSARNALGRMEFWLIYSLWVISTIVQSIYSQHLVLFALSLGISSIIASIALGIIGLSSIFGRLTIGPLQDKIGTKRALVLCYLINLASALLLIFANDRSSLYIFAAVLGFAFGGRTTLEVPLASGFFGLTSLAVILGIFETAFGVGGFIGPYFAGYMYDLTGRYHELFLFCAVASTLLLLITVAINRTKRVKTQRS